MKMLPITPLDTAKQSGAWVSYHGVQLCIRRANNIDFVKKFKQLSKPFTQEIDSESISPEDDKYIMCSSLAGTVLVDWKTYSIGEDEFKFSIENAAALLEVDDELLQFVSTYSQNIDNYLTEQVAFTVKES